MTDARKKLRTVHIDGIEWHYIVGHGGTVRIYHPDGRTCTHVDENLEARDRPYPDTYAVLPSRVKDYIKRELTKEK